MCHSLLDGNGPRTNLFFQKERPLARGSLASVGAHDDLFDVDRNFSIFLFSNKRSRGCTLNRTVSASVCLFWIYTILHTLFVCLSPITWTGHITLPFPAQHSTAQHRTAAAQDIPLHFPNQSPGNNQQQSKQASTTYTTWATSRHCRSTQRITLHPQPHEYQHRNLLPTKRRSNSAYPAALARPEFFETSKQTAEEKAELQAFVCVEPASSVRICT